MRKARWVLDGHRIPDPVGLMYSSVVSREIVRIAFTCAVLNNLDVWATDIQNAYLQALSSQRHYIVCGAEFGLENIGKQALVRRVLYGGKSRCMHEATHSDGSKHYEYILLYIDDALAIGEHPEKMIYQGIGKYFQLKEESVGLSKIYLDRIFHKRTPNNGVEVWAFSSLLYCQTAVKNMAEYLAKRNDPRWAMLVKAETPIRVLYRPELDITPVLSSFDSAYCQSL
eukprot:14191061-Ditylum_brightwellii.AAC.1